MTPADRAYAELRSRIIDLRLRPGQIIPELGLAAELGVGRNSIYDALGRLQGEGLVEPLSRRGFCVTMPTVDSMREIYEIIAALEGQAVRLAAREGGAILVAALEGAINAQELALRDDDIDAWARADRRFHELLREAAGNRRLRGLFRQFEGQLQWARSMTIRLRPKPRRSTDDHHEIVAAIRARDEEEAARIHQAHRRDTDAEILAAIRTYLEQIATPSPNSGRPP